MKTPPWIQPRWIAAECRADSFHARIANEGIEIPLTRGSDGRLTSECTETLFNALSRLAGSRSWIAPVRMICALPARGLILRPVSLPAGSPPEVSRMLQLHLEAEFPLAPEALAWGWIPAPEESPDREKVGERREFLVGAIRKEATDEWTALFSRITPQFVFTPALLVRATLLPPNTPEFVLLDLGRNQSEVLVCQPGKPPTIRTLPWGVVQLGEGETGAGLSALKTVPDSVRTWFQEVGTRGAGVPLFVTGNPEVTRRIAARFAEPGSTGGPIVPLDSSSQPGSTPAIDGILRHQNTGSHPSPNPPERQRSRPFELLELRREPAHPALAPRGQFPRRSAAIAALLLLAALAFPYVEAVLLQPALARRIATLKSGNTELATIDRELSFLQYLEQNQSPHLDAVYVIAESIPPGTRVETLSLNRQGEVSLTGWLRDANPLAEFRLKLINSGFFSSVVVEDQSPTPDRQRINFRITARWKDPTERAALKLGPEPPVTASGKAGSTNAAAGPAGSTAPVPGAPK